MNKRVKRTAKTANKAAKKKSRNDIRYECRTCGLVVKVDKPCDCMDRCDLNCCGEDMTLCE